MGNRTLIRRCFRKVSVCRFLFVLVLLAGLAQSGCLSLSGDTDLTASPTSLNFGSVAMGARVNRNLIVKNSGSAPFTITQVVASGEGFSFKGPRFPFTLAEGQSAAFATSFTPVATGSISGSLTITRIPVGRTGQLNGNSEITPSTGAQWAKIAMAGAGVGGKISITAQPENQIVTAGQSATFRVTGFGADILSYQWWKNGTAISGATSATYTTPVAVVTDSGSKFSAVIRDSAGSLTSDSATLTVNAAATPPAITAQPSAQTVVVGQAATFSVTASGTPQLAYQWMKNGGAIGGATSASYTTPPTGTINSGNQFSVVVSNASGSVTSSVATLTVKPTPVGQLAASASTLNFAAVSLGTSGTQSVTFNNTGTSNVTISSVSVSGAGYNASGMSGGLILNPGQTATLNVTFAPAVAGNLTGAVNITSNASDSNTFVTLLGKGVQNLVHTATLTWPASTTPAETGYNIFRATVSGGYTTPLNTTPISASATQFVDSTVQAGETYYYVLAFLTGSGESQFSNEVSATVPTP